MRTLLSLTILAAAAGLGFAQTSITDALRKGIIEEEVNKNLPAAIKQYSAVVQRFDEERKLFAPKGEASAAVRESYRKLLAMQCEYAARNYEAQWQRYKLGMGQAVDYSRAKRAQIEADLRFAAFDAGLGTSAPGPGFTGSPETRLGVATALYRMAECYRKSGRAEQANAAYARVISDFPEQGELTLQSRAKLPASFQVPSTPQQQAFAKIADLLGQYVESFKGYLDYMKKQVELGAMSELDLYVPQMEVMEAQSRLAAWKAGEFELALRPVTLTGSATVQDASARHQESTTLNYAIRQGQDDQARQFRQELKKLQDQADALRKADAQHVQQEIIKLQEQVDAIMAAAPASSMGSWPRAVLDIKKDIIRVEEQLKQVDGQSKPDEYGRRRLQLRLQQLQGELEAAQK